MALFSVDNTRFLWVEVLMGIGGLLFYRVGISRGSDGNCFLK